MSKIYFLVSEFYFCMVLGMIGLLFALKSDVFSITDVFLGIIAGTLIDINLRIVSKKNSVKISGYLEHKQNTLENKTDIN